MPTRLDKPYRVGAAHGSRFGAVEHFILFDRDDLTDRQIMNARVGKVYAWADARRLMIRERASPGVLTLWCHGWRRCTGPSGSAQSTSADSWCGRHRSSSVIASVVRQLDPLPVIAVKDESRLTVREHDVIGTNVRGRADDSWRSRMGARLWDMSAAKLNDPELDKAEALIRAYAEERGYNLVKVFQEEGISSVAAWRPSFEEMMRGLERGE